MKCPGCKVDLKLRRHDSFVYRLEEFPMLEHDLEVVLGSCSRCGTPLVVCRRGRSTAVDGVVELPEVLSEEILYPR